MLCPASKDVVRGVRRRREVRRSQTAMCWIIVITVLLSLNARYLIEAIKIVVSPKKLEMRTKM